MSITILSNTSSLLKIKIAKSAFLKKISIEIKNNNIIDKI